MTLIVLRIELFIYRIRFLCVTFLKVYLYLYLYLYFYLYLYLYLLLLCYYFTIKLYYKDFTKSVFVFCIGIKNLIVFFQQCLELDLVFNY